MIASCLLSFLLLFQASSPTPAPTPPVSGQQTTVTTTARTTPSANIAQMLDEPNSVTKHSMRVGSRNLNYTVTTGFMPIINDKTGETEAKLFFMAYTLDNPPAKRPLMFSFNGGPGSASVWLHLGALGPKRVKMLDDGMMPPPPYELIDNEQTWLTETDLVFIDPVGTGYSQSDQTGICRRNFSESTAIFNRSANLSGSICRATDAGARRSFSSAKATARRALRAWRVICLKKASPLTGLCWFRRC